MSVVFWANYLLEGKVVSDEMDKYYLHHYLDQLDAICEQLNVTTLSALCDFTEANFNMAAATGISLTNLYQLPDGFDMASTSSNKLMAEVGNWVDPVQALEVFICLLEQFKQTSNDLTIPKQDYKALCAELKECIQMAKDTLANDAAFNLSVIM